ncbi:hypothetical protein [Limosilactobacillus oris]|uniref:hypothetical protein n=1 Tax=Limosilactobacillus oris TaxID=1632 RepID=UPI0018836205|nr:hypothetical protein [Limosilactobacillus oris]MBF0600624.1 hypothetical protein [Limosilactobacillus oris]WHO86513.1 hypothetical protein QLX69_04740 [Limosilactobacillus oris]HJF47294.1 hypothetical protein [Limosilactobacillus oris]
MAEENYQSNEQEPGTLEQPDADRSSWELKSLDYDETLAVLNGEQKVRPEFAFADDVLAKIRKDKPELKSSEDLNSVIEDKYQQILLARYNVDQEQNVTVNKDK